MIKEKTISISDIKREVNRGISGADEQRAGELERLQIVRQAKAGSLERERERLSLNLGTTHPRVVALMEKAESNRGMVRDLIIETERAKTKLPDVDKEKWALHGYVRNRESQGVPKLTVALYDRNGRWLKELGYACTEKNGYFRLESRSAVIGQKQQLYIRALNDEGACLYVDGNSLVPAFGVVDYREIILSGDAQVCAPPEKGEVPPQKGEGATPSKQGEVTPEIGQVTTGKGEGAPPSVAKSWIVRGRVTDMEGRGMGAVIVNLFDKELVFAARLGETKTDEKGNFSFTYRAEDFRDLIEKNPDIYLKVVDQKGKTLYTSKQAIRYEAGRIETMDVKIGER
jgi:hypothetical protein